MIVLQCAITLRQAVLTGLTGGGDPNSTTSHDFLPGSSIRGACIAAFLANVGKRDLADTPNGEALFLSGANRFLNGYLVSVDNYGSHGPRSLPLPLSFRTDKYGDNARLMVDFSTGPPDLGEHKPQWQASKGPYAVLTRRVERVDDGGEEYEEYGYEQYTTVHSATTSGPLQQITIHTARTRRYGRAMNSEQLRKKNDARELPGAVFRYEALADEQVFAAYVLCDNTEDAATLRELLPQVQKIGGSRAGEYGAASVAIVYEYADSEDDAASWRETELPLPAPQSEQFTLTLLSDALIRDLATGQYVVSPQRVVDATLSGRGATCERAFCRPILVGGFNRKWGLPLPQAQAVQKGSVIVVNLPGGLSGDEARRLEEKGIGERRAEGFGRIAFGILEKRDAQADQGTMPTAQRFTLTAGSEDGRDAQLLVNRLHDRRLEELIQTQARNLNPERKGVKGSQISRLREVIKEALLRTDNTVRQAGTEAQVQPVLDHLDGLRQKTKEHLDKMIVGQQKLTRWLEGVLAHESAEQVLPNLDGISLNVGGITPQQLNAKHLALRLADAVLARAAHAPEEP